MNTFAKKLLSEGFEPFGAIPNNRQMEWYRREMTIFIHFGMNTFTSREWGDGTEDPALFDPSELDCRQWIKAIKDAGLTTAILTAKHHDGFCLWPSAYTEHSIKNSPYKNGKGDIVREFTDACAEFGIKAGIYLSPWDRHEKSWGHEEYNDFYVNQLTELFSNYGTLYECWWDGAGSTEAHYDWERWAKTVNTLQPNAVIFGSLGATPYVDVRWVGNEKGIAGKPCWATIDPISLEIETASELNQGKLGGERFIPAEADVSIRPGWFYHDDQDINVRSPKNLTDLWFRSVGRNAGFLLNLPPDKRGLLHEKDIASFTEFNKNLSNNFKTDLAEGAVVRTSSVLSHKYAPENLLSEDPERIYASSDSCPEIIFELKNEVEINTVHIQEVIELGHRVTGFEVSAMSDGSWKTICGGECIGYKFVERFETIRTSAVKLKITSSLSAPILRSFGVYFFNDPEDLPEEKAEKRDLLSGSSVNIELTEDTADINLGGIFPFDMLKMDCEGIYKMEIRIFNGTDFEEPIIVRHTGDHLLNYKFASVVDGSYRLQIKLARKDANTDMRQAKIRLY